MTDRGNETEALFELDTGVIPGPANGATYRYFNPQYVNLVGFTSIGTSSYHSFQASFLINWDDLYTSKDISRSLQAYGSIDNLDSMLSWNPLMHDRTDYGNLSRIGLRCTFPHEHAISTMSDAVRIAVLYVSPHPGDTINARVEKGDDRPVPRRY